LVDAYGMRRACRSVRTTDIAVLDLEKPESNARSAIVAECRKAIAEDHADCVLLGCAGMADLQRAIAEELGIPVVDGVAAAVKMVEGLVTLGLRTSKAGGLNYPLPKPYAGVFAPYAPADRTTLRAAE
jgi:allantoin racemase